MAMCVQCEDCKFANWDASLFCDSEEGHWDGNHYVEPYSEQFDFYCNKHEQFYLEEEITGCCRDGISGPNNYHEVCVKHYREIADLKEKLKKKRSAAHQGRAGATDAVVSAEPCSHELCRATRKKAIVN